MSVCFNFLSKIQTYLEKSTFSFKTNLSRSSSLTYCWKWTPSSKGCCCYLHSWLLRSSYERSLFMCHDFHYIQWTFDNWCTYGENNLQQLLTNLWSSHNSFSFSPSFSPNFFTSANFFYCNLLRVAIASWSVQVLSGLELSWWIYLKRKRGKMSKYVLEGFLLYIKIHLYFKENLLLC